LALTAANQRLQYLSKELPTLKAIHYDPPIALAPPLLDDLRDVVRDGLLCPVGGDIVVAKLLRRRGHLRAHAAAAFKKKQTR